MAFPITFVIATPFLFFSLLLLFTGGKISREIRPMFSVDMDGNPQLTFMRYREPVEGLRPGIFLVALNRLDGGIFSKSVVLLLDYHRNSDAIGVIINKCYRCKDNRSSFINEDLSSNNISIRVLFGGPVGINERRYMHKMTGVSHAYRIILSGEVNESNQTDVPVYIDGDLYELWKKLLLNENESKQRCVELVSFAGSSTSSYLQTNSYKLPSCSSPPSPFSSISENSSDTNADLLIIYGASRWIAGQLEDEFRNGYWGWIDATKVELFASDSASRFLWENLKSSPNLKSMQS